jgi:ABC transporter substrate binding protein
LLADQPRLSPLRSAALARLQADSGDLFFPLHIVAQSYGLDIVDNYRRAAVYVDKILRGVNPADLPVQQQQPMKFEFIVNLKAAKQIGLTIPPNVLVRADRVIR